MRGAKSFLILLIVALGLGAYIYFVESKREPAESAANKKPSVFTVDPDKVEEIQVKSASGETTTLKKTGAKWQITSPETLDADETEVTGLLSTLKGLEIQRTIDEKPATVNQYGLDPVRIGIGFRAAGDTAMHKLELGSKTPTGGDLYARVEGQPKVFLISSYVEDSLNKTTFAFREKNVLKFARDDVDNISLETTAGTPVALTRKGSDWRLSKPIDAKADFGTVDNIVGQLYQARMKSIVAPDGTKDLKKFGLEKPDATVTLGAGSTRATLAIGTKHDDTSLYARDLSRPMVFTVDKTLLDDLKKKPDDFRKKDIFEFRSFTAIGLDITTAGQTYSFGKEKPAAAAKDAKDASPAVEKWKLLKPTPKDIDQTKFTDLLTSLSNLRADKFADKAFTTGDTVEVTARFGDAAKPTTEKVTFRKTGDIVHAILPGEGGASVIVTSEFDKILATIKELTASK